jgi:hypothetical protein
MLPGLIRRGARYHIVRGIPKDLQAHYGRAVYTKALGTPDPEEARKRVVKAWAALDDEWSKVRRELKAKADKKNIDTPALATGNHPWETMKGEDIEFQIEQMDWNYQQLALEEFEDELTEAAQRDLEARLSDPKAVLTDQERAWSRLLKHQKEKAEVAEQHAAIARAQAPAEDTKPKAVPKGKTPLSTVVDRWAAEMKPKERTVTRTRNIVERFEGVSRRRALRGSG